MEAVVGLIVVAVLVAALVAEATNRPIRLNPERPVPLRWRVVPSRVARQHRRILAAMTRAEQAWGRLVDSGVLPEAGSPGRRRASRRPTGRPATRPIGWWASRRGRGRREESEPFAAALEELRVVARELDEQLIAAQRAPFAARGGAALSLERDVRRFESAVATYCRGAGRLAAGGRDRLAEVDLRVRVLDEVAARWTGEEGGPLSASAGGSSSSRP